MSDHGAPAPSSPEQLFNVLADLLDNVELSEIAISPYILPLPSPSGPTPSTSSFPFNLPSAHEVYPFTILEQDKLVVPQKPLYAVFAYAIRSLSREDVSFLYNAEEYPAQEETHVAVQRLDRCTKIILLQNPEHVKALNIRKRLLLQHLADPVQQVKEFIEQELHYTSLVLGIAANAKMATLWHHRRWLLNLQYGDHPHLLPSSTRKNRRITRLNAVGTDLPQEVLDREIELVDRAAQRYPRNYQAWAYRSWLFSTADDTANLSDRQEAEFAAMNKHLSTNVTDHTAVMHVLDLLRQQREAGREFQEVAELAMDMVERYGHRETPWLFLRGVMQLSRALGLTGLPERAGLLAEKTVKAKKESTEAGTDAPDWQNAQDVRTLNLARRTLFFLEAQNGGNHSLGSVEAREALELCRV